jgi:collagen type I/II/III/V/XI/XXIV/XXVII alpha
VINAATSIITGGAFGDSQPHTELWLSPDHAVYIDEVLIPVKHLINGTSIVQVKVDTVTYYHIELPRHDIVLAEGMTIESYLDMKDGSNYANHPGPVRLYPDFSTRMWDAFGCAPLVVTVTELEAARTLIGSFTSKNLAA